MTAFVLDCSVTVAWLFEDEAAPETDDLLERLRDDGALVPGLWRLELGNVLVQAERRNRITAAQIATYLELLRYLPIVTDTETNARAFQETLVLARVESLTTYDAACLELAMRRGMRLATRDRALMRAARRVEVETLPARAS